VSCCYQLIKLLLLTYLVLWLLRSTALLFGWIFIAQNRQVILVPGGLTRSERDVAPAPTPARWRAAGPRMSLRISWNLLAGLILCWCVRKTLKAQPLRPAIPPPGTGKHQHTHTPSLKVPRETRTPQAAPLPNFLSCRAHHSPHITCSASSSP
jgi:hypothetical protein